MPKRTLGVLGVVAFAALALPFGMPTMTHASSSVAAYDSISVKPLPLEQPGTIGTTTVTACVQPLASGAPVPGASVLLSIDNGLFTAPPTTATGTASVGATALTATPVSFPVQATCNYMNAETSGHLSDAVQVSYTGPTATLVHGRDVIAAQMTAGSFNAATGQCAPSSICNTATYVFSPVGQYQFTNPIAPTGSLTAGQPVTDTITALDNSSTPHPVPGAFIDLSLSSTAAGLGTATAVNNFSGFTRARINNSPNRFGADSNGQVVVTYTAATPVPSSGVDTITIQSTPTHPLVIVATSYTYGATSTPSSAPYTAVSPSRVCDTRPAGGGIPSNQCNNDSTGAGMGPITQGATRVITVDGNGGLPGSGVTAVVMNVTAIAPTKGTLLTLYPDGGTRPGTSNVNPSAGEVLANLVEVGVSAAGKVDVFNALGTINVALDIEGYVSSGSIGKFTPTAPVRICDTRGTGPGISSNPCNGFSSVPHPIGPGGILSFNVSASPSPVPSSGVTAVVFNLTAIAPTIRTVLTAYPGPHSNSPPNASNININPGTAVPNRVIVPVPLGCSGATCLVNIWNGLGSVNVAVDIDGYFSASGAKFTAIQPARVCDSRSGNVNVDGCKAVFVGAGAANVFSFNITGIDGIDPLQGAGTPPPPPVAIVANVTAVNATTSTFVTVYPGPSTQPVPNASDLNEPTFEPVTNLVVVQVGADGTINLYNAKGNVNLIVDVLGFYS